MGTDKIFYFSMIFSHSKRKEIEEKQEIKIERNCRLSMLGGDIGFYRCQGWKEPRD